MTVSIQPNNKSVNKLIGNCDGEEHYTIKQDTIESKSLYINIF